MLTRDILSNFSIYDFDTVYFLDTMSFGTLLFQPKLNYLLIQGYTKTNRKSFKIKYMVKYNQKTFKQKKRIILREYDKIVNDSIEKNYHHLESCLSISGDVF